MYMRYAHKKEKCQGQITWCLCFYIPSFPQVGEKVDNMKRTFYKRVNNHTYNQTQLCLLIQLKIRLIGQFYYR